MPMKTTGSRSTSGEEEAFSDALLNACSRLRTLEDDINAYVLKSKAEVKADLKQRQSIAATRDSLKHLSAPEFEAWLDTQAEVYVNPSVQYKELIGNRFRAEFVTIVLTSATLCEALINVFVAYGLAVQDHQELFTLVDKWGVKEKWEHAPKLFITDYEFPKELSLWQILCETIQSRNAVAHYKMMLKIGEDEKYKGRSIYAREYFSENLNWLKKVANLPYELNLFLVRIGREYDAPRLLPITGPFPDERIVDWEKYDRQHHNGET